MQDQHDLSNVNMDSDFAEALHGIIFEKRPVKIIETGTYHGTGTTAIIAKALEQCKIENAVFYSIEVNPENVKQALDNLQKQHVLQFVKILNGLSIPRNLLPSIAEIEEKCVNHIEFPNLYIDHHKHERVKRYSEETNWESLPDDLLGKCLNEFNYRPDFVLLDSAGHIGNIEFNYLIDRLKGNCIIALDDTRHIKHHKSLLQMQGDPRFRLLVNSVERTGFCIALFNPIPEAKQDNRPATAFLSDLIKKGESLFAQGKTMEAIQCFQDVLARDPVNVTALNNLGVMAFQLNDPELAENFLVKAVRLNRRDPESIANLANLYAQQGNLLTARALVAEARAGGLILSDLDPLLQIDGQPHSLESVDEKSRSLLNPQKILVINNLFPPQELGGYGRVMADYTLLLRQRGHQVEVLTSDTRALGQPPESELHVQRTLKLFGEWTDKGMVEFPRDRIMTIVSQNEQIIHQALEQLHPDICLVGNIDLLSVLVFRPIFALHIPVLHRLGNEFIGYRVNDAPRDPFYHVATASQWLKDEGISRGYPFENAIVIHSGAFTKEFQMVLPPATDGLRIAFAGLVNGYKGPQVLVEALDLLSRKNIPFTCTIAGGSFDSQFMKSLQNRVMTLGLADKISFSGLLNRTELKNLYARHNILVFSSLVSETFGISQVEAMAAGLLVVTSAKGGAKEVIEDEVSGLFFKPGDHHALAALLLSVLQNREKWERIALCGRQRALEQFDIEQAVDKLETAFKNFFKNPEMRSTGR